MHRLITPRSELHAANTATFLAFGILIYVALLAAAEWLTWHNGHANAILKVERAIGDYDWVILGASHAMPLDYDDFNGEIEAATGKRVLNLAAPGAGPLYNRFTFEHFLRRHRTRHVLYVVDSFAFRSPQWNEERFPDPSLLGRTPFSFDLAASLGTYVWNENVDPRTWLDYATGFSKLNNRQRFKPDVFEGETQFDRIFKPSATADRKRVEYLYPAVEDEDAHRARYLSELAELVGVAEAAGAITELAKFPLPARFSALLPGEADFDAGLAEFAAGLGLALHDYSAVLEGREFYADTDHLNRAGARALLNGHLRSLLAEETEEPAVLD